MAEARGIKKTEKGRQRREKTETGEAVKKKNRLQHDLDNWQLAVKNWRLTLPLRIEH